MQKIVQVVCVVLIAAAVMFGGRWYMYVAQGSSPYDEVGIALNGYAPGPMRAWGCHKMQARFPGSCRLTGVPGRMVVAGCNKRPSSQRKLGCPRDSARPCRLRSQLSLG